MGRVVARASEPVEQFFQFSLLGLLASGYLALAGSGSLDLPTLVFTAAGLILRFLLIAGVVRLDLDTRWTTAATLLYIGFYPLDVLYISREFIPATVHLICFLAVVRVLTARTNRDYFFVKLIAFLELVAATLLSMSLNFFVFLVLFVIFGVATFACSEIRRSGQLGRRRVVALKRFHGRLAAITALITVSILLMTAGLFFILPRTARAAFRSMVSERYHLPGFSNEITLGQIGELQQRNTPVMHVKVEPPNDRTGMKWRGAALSQFDGKRWYNPRSPVEAIRLRRGINQLASETQRGRRSGDRISYMVRLGPTDSDTLFFAGIPELLQIDDVPVVFRSSGDAYRTGSRTLDGRRYLAVAHRPEVGPLVEGEVAELPEQTYNEHLLLPGSIDRRIIELSRAKGTGAAPVQRAKAIEKYLRTEFSYTTDLLQQQVKDPLAHFLFERRKGHCEYFASAMAVMLRSIHIPARVVTGFQSGVYNPMTGWHIIRASDAHSWVEAWLPGRGWTTFDPTPPDPNAALRAGALWTRVLLYLDAAETVWRDWVVGYNLEQQLDLMSRVERGGRLLETTFFADRVKEFSDRMVEAVKPLVVYFVGLFVVAILGFVFGPRLWKLVLHRRNAARISRGEVVASDAAILYARMLEVLRQRGLEKPGWLTPGEFARIVPPSPTAELVQDITSAYHDLRYGNKPDAGPRMVQLLQDLETAS